MKSQSEGGWFVMASPQGVAIQTKSAENAGLPRASRSQ